MTDAISKGKLNIHGFLDLDQMAAVLSGLLDQVDRQNKVINALRDSLLDYVDSNLFSEKISSLEQLLSSLAKKTDAIQIATTASVLNKKIAAGDLASSNFQQLSHLSKSLRECATKADLAKQQLQIDDLEAALLRLQQSFDKVIVLTDQLSRSQLHQGQRISNLESAVAGKIDRSECDHLESLVAKVELYDDFRMSTIRAVSGLQDFQELAVGRLQEAEEQLRRHQQSLQQQAADMGRLAPKRELHSLAKELQQQQLDINKRATKDNLEQVAQELRAAEELAVRHSADLVKHSADLQELHTLVDGKASLQAVRNCVTRRHYEQAVAALGAQVDSKTPSTTTHKMQQQILGLESGLADAAERLGVALRFVEWFSGRGENYEHNMKIIDKHLRGLLAAPPGDPNAQAPVHTYSTFMPGNRVIFGSDMAPSLS